MSDFLARLTARAAAKGINEAKLREEWRRAAVQTLPFPLTRDGYTRLADPWTHEIHITGALQMVLLWLLAPPAKREVCLCFVGPTGTGKSFAAAFLCVVRTVLRDEGAALPEWISSRSMSKRVLVEQDVNLGARTLVIDDVGAHAITEGAMSAMEEVLDARGRPDVFTLLTSNMKASEIGSKYGARARSRLIALAGKSIACTGSDLRTGEERTNEDGADA
jgi:hypothetical protein